VRKVREVREVRAATRDEPLPHHPHLPLGSAVVVWCG
jgi:hypothetical protein